MEEMRNVSYEGMAIVYDLVHETKSLPSAIAGT